MAGINHSTVVTGGNDGTKQVSQTAWNADHIINGDVTFAGFKAINILGLSAQAGAGMTITAASSIAGSASTIVSELDTSATTLAFTGGVAQTGEYITRRIGQITITNATIGTVTNASTVKIIGAPVAGTGMTITNSYALWIAAGTSKFDGSITSTGGITMSGSDITIAGNKLKTTTYQLTETALEFTGAGILIQPSAVNTKGIAGIAGSGTATNTIFDIFRTSDVFTNVEGLRLGTDVNVSNELAIQSLVKGLGILRPINIYMQGMRLFSFDVTNTITSYVDFGQTTGKKIGLNVGLTSYMIETSAGQIDIFTNSNQGLRIVQGATTTTENNVVIGKISALATTTTDGFLHIPSGAGAPTGVPTAFIGKIAMYYDTTNNKIWFYNGAWRGVVVA